MAQESPLLQEFWEQSLKHMPRKEVQEFLKEVGVNLPTANLSEDQVRKLLYGFLAQLDAEVQENAIHMLNGKS